jgi:hypothetical protein
MRRLLDYLRWLFTLPLTNRQMEEREFADVPYVAVSDDGITISMKIKTKGGNTLPVRFHHDAFTAFVQSLIGIGAQASEHRTSGQRIPIGTGPQPKLSPLCLATQCSFAGKPQNMYLVVRLYDMDVAFRVEKPTIQRLQSACIQATKAIDEGASR